MDLTTISDEQLAAEAAREGSDGPAFVELLQRYQQRVWAVCYRLMGNADDARDASQEVFVRLFFHRTKFAGRSKYSTWVHGIAIRTCLGLRRGRGRRQRREAKAASEAPVATTGDDTRPDAALDLNQMLECLEEEDRAMLILKYSQGHSHEELAEMFDLSVSACKMRISRAREKLKTMYPEHDFGEAGE